MPANLTPDVYLSYSATTGKVSRCLTLLAPKWRFWFFSIHQFVIIKAMSVDELDLMFIHVKDC
jgi:hypothetical protein